MVSPLQAKTNHILLFSDDEVWADFCVELQVLQHFNTKIGAGAHLR